MNDVQWHEARAALRSWRADLESVIHRALVRIAECDAAAFSGYQRARAFEDLLELSNCKDCCYDRPGTGFAYASWYHPRRVHELARRFLGAMDDMPSDEVRLVDLGAGTGATAWAAALAALARATVGARVPARIDVLAVETSPSMLEASDVLWAEFAAWATGRPLPEMTVEPVARPWTDPPEVAQGAWLVAGHLFDASDADDEIRQQFRRLVVRTEPSVVLIDAPASKQLHLLAAVAGVEEAGWETVPLKWLTDRIWSGPLRTIGELRRAVYRKIGVTDGLGRNPGWDDGPALCRADLRRGGGATSSTGDRQLFLLGTRGLALDDDQDEIATPRDRFDVVIGAAGSGKSIVLVERIARTVEMAAQVGVLPRILVTTRNVPMVDQLAAWLGDRLRPPARAHMNRPGDHEFSWDEPIGRVEIRLLNWDKVPTQLFDSQPTGSSDDDAIQRRIRSRESQGWSALDLHREYLGNVKWLQAELRRVIHGQRLRSLPEYLQADRAGRGKALAPNLREHVWALLMETRPAQTSYTYRWMDLVDRHCDAIDGGGRIVPVDGAPFTHAFVDEVQDFTVADIEFLAALVGDPRRLFLVGDAGQAMLLGATFDVPGVLRRRRREVRELTHSYRLSRRMAEAVQPLAAAMLEQVQRAQRRWVGVPRGTRSGVPGCRPVVLCASDALGTELREVFRAYARLLAGDNVIVTIAEESRDSPLLELVRNAVPASLNATVRAETMAKIKGLERSCVVWPTDKRWSLDETASEFVHTVLTRATSLAIIVFDPSATDADTMDALGRLSQDRLLFWTEAAENEWTRRYPRA